MIVSDYRSITGDALIVIAGVLVILLINRIVAWQESRAEQRAELLINLGHAVPYDGGAR